MKWIYPTFDILNDNVWIIFSSKKNAKVLNEGEAFDYPNNSIKGNKKISYKS